MLPYRQLVVHELSLKLMNNVLDLLDTPAFEKRFWLQNQLSAAVCSISANIAEGNGRSTPLDYASFVDRARGSAFEVDNWLLIAAQRGWCSPETQAVLSEDIDHISAMLYRLASQLRRKSELESRTRPLR